MLITQCKCDCGCENNEVEGAENVDLGVAPTLNNEVDRQAHLRKLLDSWVQAVDFRSDDDVQQWIENEGYRPRDAINRLKLESDRGEPIDGDPWPDKTRDPRSSNPYPVSLSNSAVRTYSSDEGFDWDLSVGK